MPAWTNDNGENYADELDYKLWNPALESYQYISLDQAQGKVITMTEVSPYDGNVTIHVKDKEDAIRAGHLEALRIVTKAAKDSIFFIEKDIEEDEYNGVRKPVVDKAKEDLELLKTCVFMMEQHIERFDNAQ